jgi:hypothetical protein
MALVEARLQELYDQRAMQAFLLGFYQESIFVFLIMLREGSLK